MGDQSLIFRNGHNFEGHKDRLGLGEVFQEGVDDSLSEIIKEKVLRMIVVSPPMTGNQFQRKFYRLEQQVIVRLDVAILHNYKDHACQILEISLVQLGRLVIGVLDADVFEKVELAVHVELPVADEYAFEQGLAADFLAFDEQMSETHERVVEVFLFDG